MGAAVFGFPNTAAGRADENRQFAGRLTVRGDRSNSTALGLLDERFRFVGRHLLGIFPAAERKNLPGGGAIIGSDNRHSLQSGVGAHLAELLFYLGVFKFDLTLIDQQTALEPD